MAKDVMLLLVIMHSVASWEVMSCWVLGKPAAFDLSVTPTLNAQVFRGANVSAGPAALAACPDPQA